MKTKINSVLEKKVEELDYLLEDITLNGYNPNVYRKIELGVLFAKTLLTAEISSRPMDVEGEEDVQLACMAKRLTEIEAFIITNQLLDHGNGSIVEPEIGSMETKGGETGSVYSWVESCLNESTKAEEEEEEDEEEFEAEQWPLFQDASDEEKMEVMFPVAEAVKEEVVVREVKEKRRVGFKALVCFGLIGLVSGIMSLFCYIGDNIKEDNLFLVPT